MPQLDTIHIFITFLWTWFTLILIMKKTKTFKITSNPKKTDSTKLNPKTALPWM